MHFHWDFLQKQGGIVARFSIGSYKAWRCFCWHRLGWPLIWLPKTSSPDWFRIVMVLWLISSLTLATFNHWGGAFLSHSWSSSPVTCFCARAITCPWSPKGLILGCVSFGLMNERLYSANSPAPGTDPQPWGSTALWWCLGPVPCTSLTLNILTRFFPEIPGKCFTTQLIQKSLSSPPLFAQNMSNRQPAGCLLLIPAGGPDIVEAKEQLFSCPSLGWCITMLGPAQIVRTFSLWYAERWEPTKAAPGPAFICAGYVMTIPGTDVCGDLGKRRWACR